MGCCDKLRAEVSLLVRDVLCVVVRLLPYKSRQVKIVVITSCTIYELLELAESINITFTAYLSESHSREIFVYFLGTKIFPAEDLHAYV